MALTRERLEQLIARSSDIVVATDRKGTVVYYNDGASEVLGYKPEEVLGGFVAHFYPTLEEAKRVMSAMRSASHGGRGICESFRTTFVSKSGEHIPVAISGTILFIIIGATTFAQVLSFSGVVNGILGLITGQGLPPMTVIIGMILILLFLGCFVDQVSMMLITLPFFMPLVQQLGIDPIWFGIIFLICMQLGLLTPPFGLLLFTMKSVAPPSVNMAQIYWAAIPYVVFGVLVLALILMFPPVATWLPGILGGR